MTALAVLASGLSFPEGPTLSPDGQTLYCVNVGASFLSRLDLRTHIFTREWVTLPDNGRGNGMTLGPDGALYVADVGARRIVRVGLPDGNITVIVDKTDTGEALLGPNDLVFSRDGDLYFTDPNGSHDMPIGAVYKVAHGTRAVSQVAGGLRYPNGLVLSPDEKTLYVALSPLNSVVAFDLAGGTQASFASVPSPDGMRARPGGGLYVACYSSGEIAEVGADGEVLRRLPAGGANPTNLCFAPGGRGLYVTESATDTLVYLPLGE